MSPRGVLDHSFANLLVEREAAAGNGAHFEEFGRADERPTAEAVRGAASLS